MDAKKRIISKRKKKRWIGVWEGWFFFEAIHLERRTSILTRVKALLTGKRSVSWFQRKTNRNQRGIWELV